MEYPIIYYHGNNIKRLCYEKYYIDIQPDGTRTAQSWEGVPEEILEKVKKDGPHFQLA